MISCKHLYQSGTRVPERDDHDGDEEVQEVRQERLRLQVLGKLTRRSLIAAIAALPVALAGTRVSEAAQAAEPMTACGHITAECCDACWGTSGVSESATRSYANGRADGYNRGREVESAAWEARQDQGFTWTGAGWVRVMDLSPKAQS